MLLSAALRRSAYRTRHTAVAAAVVSLANNNRRLYATTSRGPPSPNSSSSPSSSAGQPPSMDNTAAAAASTPTETTPRTAAKESRFTRSSFPGSAPSTYSDGSAADAATSPASAAGATLAYAELQNQLMMQLTAPRELRLARTAAQYLHRVQNVLRRWASQPSVAAVARNELQKILLPSIRGLDAPLLIVFLQTLQQADMPTFAPIIHDAVAWLNLYAYHMSLPHLAKVVEALLVLYPPAAHEVVRGLPQRLSLRDVRAFAASQVVTLLTAVLPCLPVSRDSGMRDEAEKQHAGSPRNSAPTQRGSASSSQVDLVSLAAALRDRCTGKEYAAVEPNAQAQLLIALWTFRQSRGWRSVTDAEAWLSVEEATCYVVARAPQLERLELFEIVSLLDACIKVQGVQSAAASTNGVAAAAAASEAASHLSVALLQRLQSDMETLRACTAAEVSSSARQNASMAAAAAALPARWTARDVAALWQLAVENRSKTTKEVVGTSSHQSSTANEDDMADTYRRTLSTVQPLLLTCMTSLFTLNTADVGFAELLFGMSRSLVVFSATTDTEEGFSVLPTPIDAATSAAATAAASLTDLSALLPPSLLQALLLSSSGQLQASSMTWTPSAVRDAVYVFAHSRDSSHRERALELSKMWYAQLQARAQSGERLQPQELLAFFTPELLRQEQAGVNAAVQASLSRWSVSEVLFFFARLGVTGGRAGGLEGAAVLRQAGASLCAYAAKATAGQLAALVECYGAARVRSDAFCEAAIKRLSELLDANLTSAARHSSFSSLNAYSAAPSAAVSGATAANAAAGGGASSPSASPAHNTTSARDTEESLANATPVTLSQLTQLLRSFALMETRQTKAFVDAAGHVIQAVEADQGTAEEITHLLASYAKMLIWNYPVFRALAERLCRMSPEEVPREHLVTAQLALIRMDVALPALTARFFAALEQAYAGESAATATSTSSISRQQPSRTALRDAVMELSLLSRLRNRTSVAMPDARVVAALTQTIVSHAPTLRIEEIAEVLTSLARIGEGKSDAFGQLTVRTLNLLPTSAPRVMAHVVEAYALAGRHDSTELFTLVADRTVAMRHDIAAVTIGSILASFAKAGVRNDRLFIEVISRVRHVATYGTPRDVVNVVGAYAAVNVWHYKLFARLADRAIQLRADFRVSELVRLLQAYASVQMRYDSLFTEFAPRIQTLSHLLAPAELASIVSSYSQLSIPCTPVWKATAARAVAVVDLFAEADARVLLDAYATQGYYNKECVGALVRRFPSLASIPFDVEGSEEAEPRKPSDAATSA